MSETVIVYAANADGAYQGPIEVVDGQYPELYSQTEPVGELPPGHQFYLENGNWVIDRPSITCYYADPISGLYLGVTEVDRNEPKPNLYIEQAPTPEPGKLPILKEGVWVNLSLPPMPAASDYPVVPVVVTKVNLPLNKGLYNGYTSQQVIVTGVLPGLPPGPMTIIVGELVGNKIIAKERRFDALIEETEDPNWRRFTLTLRWKDSGNYLITQERLNEGLEQVNEPIRIALEKLEFNIREA